jgi:hypothetical protein
MKVNQKKNHHQIEAKALMFIFVSIFTPHTHDQAVWGTNVHNLFLNV